MNKTFVSIILLILFISIFSSCTIQKRRHFRGFHIEFLTTKFLNSSKSIKEKKKHFSKNNDTLLVKNSISNLNVVSTNFSTTNSLVTKKPNYIHQTILNTGKPTNLNKKTSNSKPLLNRLKNENNTKINMLNNFKQQSAVDELPKKNKISKRKLALIIGISLLLMAVVAAITVPPLTELFVLNNATLTGLNVTSNFGKYTAAVFGWVIIGILDLIASWGIYKYYKDEEPKKAKITSGLRVLYTAILGVGIAQLFMVSSLSSAATIYSHINMFNKIWGIGLIVFGFHLIALGLLYKNEGGKRWVNITIKSLLIAAGIGYIIQYVGIMLVANPVTYAAFVQPIFIIPMILGEILYAIWKIAKGGKKTTK
ncbi:MAG: DUF4386 domain-containing protein [Bacteroidia bacterium]|nr:DUF4386 domain-containing protein [Bacteroidia bacterium]